MFSREMDSDNHNAPCFSLADLVWLNPIDLKALTG